MAKKDESPGKKTRKLNPNNIYEEIGQAQITFYLVFFSLKLIILFFCFFFIFYIDSYLKTFFHHMLKISFYHVIKKLIESEILSNNYVLKYFFLS